VAGVVILIWALTLVFALVVLSFCAYELHWKLVRFRSDIDRVANLATRAREIGDDAETTLARVAKMQAEAAERKASRRKKLGPAPVGE